MFTIWKITDRSTSAVRQTHIVYTDVSDTWDDYMPKLCGYCDRMGVSVAGRCIEAIGVTPYAQAICL